MTPQERIDRAESRQKLQREWYNLLKESGFDDIETFDRSMEPYHDLKMGFKTNVMTADNEIPTGSAKIQYYTTLEYYSMADDFSRLSDDVKVFRTPLEKEVWDLHCQGVINSMIARIVGINKSTVGRMINKYKLKLSDQ